MFRPALIDIKIDPNNQPVTKDELNTILETFSFLCKKAGWSVRFEIWPYDPYGGHYWRGIITDEP